MSRNPRPGTCPGLTKTQQLRQARSAAIAKDSKRGATRQPEEIKVRRRYDRPDPKKVDFTKPGMTKAMMARVKQAEKFKQEYESKRETYASGHFPRRTPAPIGGDARMGRERITGRRTPAASPTRAPQTPKRAGPSVTPSKGGTMRHSPRAAGETVPRKTAELAKMMNAEVIQADPIGEGPINNIVIPAGTVSGDRTAIVSIVQPGEGRVASPATNRSIQVISETLDEQDAAESAVVQGRLSELQNARREFVIAVANVGGNVVQLDDVSLPTYMESPSPRSPPRVIYKVPDVEDERLQLQYGIDHPDIVAAREYMKKVKEDMEKQEAWKRLDEEFKSLRPPEMPYIPIQKDLMAWEQEDEFYQYPPFDPDELEKFFDVKRYPPCPQCGPPPGREEVHPDLWDIEDPWVKRPPPEPEGPDLIEFEEDDLIQFD
ncbi:hypothetical protein ANTPLA_LOCUS329 [Anthophora plagiata]